MKGLKLILLLLLVLSFAAPGYAGGYIVIPGNCVIFDDLAAEEWAAEFEARRGRGEIGALSPRPEIEFGQRINVNRSNWPESAQAGFARQMRPLPGRLNPPPGMEQGIEAWLQTPAFQYAPHGRHSRTGDNLSRVGPAGQLPQPVSWFTNDVELDQWFEDLANLPDSRMRFRRIHGFPYYSGDGGYNPDGTPNYRLERVFSMILAVFSNPTAFTPEEVKALGRPVLWIQGMIHSNEPSTTEGMLQLARELASGVHDDMLEKITVVMVPRFNVSGAWNNSRTTTDLAPVGHAGAGPAGVDMNRDFVGHESIQTRNIRQLNMLYNPVVNLCAHQMGVWWSVEHISSADDGTAGGPPYPTGTVPGTLHPRYYPVNVEHQFAGGTRFRRDFQPGMTTIITHNLNLCRDVRVRVGMELIEETMQDYLEAGGVGWDWYTAGTSGTRIIPMDVVDRDGVSGPVPGDIRHGNLRSDFALVPDEGGVGGLGLANQSLVFVTEASSVGGNTVSGRLDYLRRVYANYLAFLAACRALAENADEVMSIVNRARETEIARTEPLSFWGLRPESRPGYFNVLSYSCWRKTNTPEVVEGMSWVRRPVMEQRGYWAERDPDASVVRPAAYIIPAQHYQAAIRLFYTGATIERLAQDTTITVEAYTVESIGNLNWWPGGGILTSGTVSQVPIGISEVSKTTRAVTFPKDSFVVRMDQLGASLAGVSLEPRAIRNFGNFYLSRTPGLHGLGSATQRTNSNRIPGWHAGTWLPVAVGQEFPAFRYMGTGGAATLSFATYPAHLNAPIVLTAVDRVHSPTQAQIEEIRAALELVAAPEYISVLQFRGYMAGLPSGLILPNGEIVDLDTSTGTTLIVAPEGLSGPVFAAGVTSGANGVVLGQFNFVQISEGTQGYEPRRSSGCTMGFPAPALLVLALLALKYKRAA